MAGGRDYLEFSESKNWNVARKYSELKILKYLLEADDYADIAKFGTSQLIDEFIVNDNMKNEARLKAMKRLLNCLQMTIDNSEFALKKKDKIIIQGYSEDLKKIEKVIPYVSRTSFNQRDKKKHIVIDEEKFNIILGMLIELKKAILEPLNNAELIFGADEAMDPDELKKRIMEDIVFSG